MARAFWPLFTPFCLLSLPLFSENARVTLPPLLIDPFFFFFYFCAPRSRRHVLFYGVIPSPPDLAFGPRTCATALLVLSFFQRVFFLVSYPEGDERNSAPYIFEISFFLSAVSFPCNLFSLPIAVVSRIEGAVFSPFPVFLRCHPPPSFSQLLQSFR